MVIYHNNNNNNIVAYNITDITYKILYHNII